MTQPFLVDEDHAILHLMYDHTVDRLSVRWNHPAEPVEEDIPRFEPTILAPYLSYRMTWETGQLAFHDAAGRMVTLQPHGLFNSRVFSRSPEQHHHPIKDTIIENFPPGLLPVFFWRS